MDEVIERLRRCGIPERTALRICFDFLKRGKRAELMRYVNVEENERDLVPMESESLRS